MLRLNRAGLRFVAGLAIVASLALMLSCGADDTNGSDRNSSMAPGFVLEDLGGRKVSSQEFVGKITILNFWTTWCTYCRKEIPHLNELYEDYRSRGVEVVGVSFDDRGAADVIPFMQKVPMNYPILIGNRSVGNSFGGIVGFPTTIILDRKWQIFKKYPGLTGKDVLEHDIKVLLARD